jgi:hypothetical protein
MKVKLLLPLAVSLLYSSYSYSETVFGSGTATGLSWVMTEILPQQTGLTVGNVIYKYTVTKDTSADLLVHVQNSDLLDPSSYIFRSTDDWSGLPGNSIRKVVPTSLSIDRLGPGSIVTEGFGTVSSANVTYTYQYDPCFVVVPGCPGFVEPPTPSVEWTDPFTLDMLDAAPLPVDSEDDVPSSLEEPLEEESLEKLLGGVNSTLLVTAANVAAAKMIAMNVLPTSYYSSIPGGRYTETIQYSSDQMPSNVNALRVGLAQQIKHQEMVQMQYRGALAQEKE